MLDDVVLSSACDVLACGSDVTGQVLDLADVVQFVQASGILEACNMQTIQIHENGKTDAEKSRVSEVDSL